MRIQKDNGGREWVYKQTYRREREIMNHTEQSGRIRVPDDGPAGQRLGRVLVEPDGGGIEGIGRLREEVDEDGDDPENYEARVDIEGTR